MISKTLTEFKIRHDKYTTIINEEEKNRRLKESIGIIKSLRNDIESR